MHAWPTPITDLTQDLDIKVWTELLGIVAIAICLGRRLRARLGFIESLVPFHSATSLLANRQPLVPDAAADGRHRVAFREVMDRQESADTK